jgi:ABC-type multidrug transport system ATPase subunit
MLLCGESILTEGGLDRATGLIGVCPQFDVLWGELTGREHLLVAGHVKGLPWTQVGVVLGHCTVQGAGLVVKKG